MNVLKRGATALAVGCLCLAAAGGETGAGPKLPDEDAGRPCISSFPFPDRLSQYVWRNWTLVPHDRLAEVVGAKEGELEEIAAEMGLPRKVAVLPEWQTKGYITVLRRNWQILDYPQLIRLLGITREEMRFRLLEDDFLWGKLGRVKPKCGALAYATDAAASAARRRLATVLREEGVDPAAAEEPRFAFVRALSEPIPGWKPRTGANESPFDLRMIFSYFADYGDPLVHDDIRSYPEGLLQRLADQGINAIWLHTALRTLTTDPKYPEFGVGSERRLANLRKLCRRAAKYGIRVYLYVNEPRGLPADFFEVNAERRAMRGTDHNMRWAMCTSHPESLRWLRDALTQLFSNVPELAGMFTITMNENLSHCGSKWGKKRCPRCRNRSLEDLVAELCRAEIEGMRRGNPKAEAVVWDWSWPQGKDGSEKAIIDALEPGSCRLMTVSEIGVPLDRGARVSVNEYSISAPGPSERAKRCWKDARARGLKTAAKVQANVSWEISPFPYVPTMDLVAEHAVNLADSGVGGALLSWSLGCAPSPNLAAYDFIRRGDTRETLLNRLATHYYGAAAADVRKAWTAFSDGYRNYPFTYQVIYNAPVHWGSANPLYPVRTGYKATMVGLPYDDLAGWRAMYPEERWIAQMEKIATGFDEGCRLFAKAVGRLEGAARADAARELSMFRAEQLHFRSTVDQARFVQARDRGDREGMRRMAARELEAAKALLPIVRADSRIGYECSNHYFYVPQDLIEKILGCRAILDGVAPTADAGQTVIRPLAGGWTCDGESVRVPHTWNAVDAADGIGRAPDWRKVGYSSGATSYVRKAVLYRRALPDAKPGRRYFIRCAGASMKTVTRVNGVEIGRHTGAFTAFCHEATAALKPTGNVLEMSVDSRVDLNVQPFHADFSVYGGLYRTPEWIETDPVCLDRVTDGACGVVLEPDAATGEVVARVAVLGGTNEVQRFRVPGFKRWTPETPHLYTRRITVRQNGSEDSTLVRFGFRTVEMRADGFYLNGVKRKLRGVCRHQDREGRGWCRSREDEAEDVRWMKKMGADAVRTSHYPQSPAFYDLCDEAGLVVWTEVPNVDGLTFAEEARQNEIREAREMVMQHRNHPSVAFWGIFNELYNVPSKRPYEPRMEALRDYVKALDPTRPVAAASNDPNRAPLNRVPEALGLNLYPGWYGGKSTDMGTVLDRAFVRNPTRTCVAVTEYGCGGAVSQHADVTFRMPKTESDFHPEEYQAGHHWANYRAIAADARVWGSFAWVMFDAGSDAKVEGPRHGINDKGLVTWDRSTAKDAFYLYKANWNPEPELHLVGARMTETTDAQATVMAFSNVGDVTLVVNGKPVGTQGPDAVKTVRWEKVPLAAGANEIVVTAGPYRKVAHWMRRLPAFPRVSAPRRLTSGPKEHFLANYFAIDAWSPNLRYVLALETDLNGRLPEAGERCTLGIIDLKDGNRFIPITTTACWNFQEAAMAFWMDNDTILFNDVRDGQFRAVVMNWKTKAERVLPLPVSAVSEDRTWAVSINYARLSLTRPDYGYAGPGQNARATVDWPEDDGLWTMDLKTGATKMILSVAQGRPLMVPTKPVPGKPGQPLAYYCHTVVSKDGAKIFFLARSVNWFDARTHKTSIWETTSFTVNRDGSGLRRCFKDGWAGSHFNWAPDGSHRMIVTAKWDAHKTGEHWSKNMVWMPVEFTVGEEEKVRRLGGGMADKDWHCVYSPDGKFMSGETYWDKADFSRPWILMRLGDEAILPIGRFFVPEKYRGTYWRCDLHARWRRDGRQLAFNSVHEGSRQIYVMDVTAQP